MSTFFHGEIMQKKIRRVTVDIETLAVPERCGYGIIIPNYAMVTVPEKPTDPITEYMYVIMSVDQQMKKGLQCDGSGMAFWFDTCAKEYPGAHGAMLPSLSNKNAEGFLKLYDTMERISDHSFNGYTPVHAIKAFMNPYRDDSDDYEIYGNGCNFDCSILQENHRVMYGEGNLWKYTAPQNARTLKNLLSTEQRTEMDEIVSERLPKFVERVGGVFKHGHMELHHPLYDAAREAIQISYCLQQKLG